MCATKDSLLLKGLQWSMVSRAASRIGATVSVEGRSYSYNRTYEPSISQSGSLGLRGPTFASLAENNDPTTISDGASPTTPTTLGDPPVRTPSSSDAYASLEAS